MLFPNKNPDYDKALEVFYKAFELDDEEIAIQIIVVNIDDNRELMNLAWES